MSQDLKPKARSLGRRTFCLLLEVDFLGIKKITNMKSKPDFLSREKPRYPICIQKRKLFSEGGAPRVISMELITVSV